MKKKNEASSRGNGRYGKSVDKLPVNWFNVYVLLRKDEYCMLRKSYFRIKGMVYSFMSAMHGFNSDLITTNSTSKKQNPSDECNKTKIFCVIFMYLLLWKTVIRTTHLTIMLKKKKIASCQTPPHTKLQSPPERTICRKPFTNCWN